jgi:hypothetical protein
MRQHDLLFRICREMKYKWDVPSVSFPLLAVLKVELQPSACVGKPLLVGLYLERIKWQVSVRQKPFL